MKSVKRKLLVFASVCILAVGVTLAVLSQVTETATNTFTSNRSIALSLREDKWDGYTFNDEYPGVPGTVAKDPNNKNLGINIAKAYYPGDQIPKNPVVKNVSPNDEKEYVAIKVEYINHNGSSITKAEFESLYGKLQTQSGVTFTDGVNSGYELISDTSSKYDLYFYQTELNKGVTTVALFDQIVINTNIKDVNGKWPNFQVKITAYAIQSKNVSATDAKTELLKMANEN